MLTIRECSVCKYPLSHRSKHGLCPTHFKQSDTYKTRNRANALRYARENPDVRRDRDLRKTYGIGLEEVLEIIRTQGGGCAICKWPFDGYGKYTHVDHDHKTGKVRGILCDHCNYGLGHFRDSTEFLGEAVAYLQRNL